MSSQFFAIKLKPNISIKKDFLKKLVRCRNKQNVHIKSSGRAAAPGCRLFQQFRLRACSAGHLNILCICIHHSVPVCLYGWNKVQCTHFQKAEAAPYTEPVPCSMCWQWRTGCSITVQFGGRRTGEEGERWVSGQVLPTVQGFLLEARHNQQPFAMHQVETNPHMLYSVNQQIHHNTSTV